MGIKLGNTSMKMGNKTAIVSSPFPIVETMVLTTSLENGRWYFSLNGFTNYKREALRAGDNYIYLQLNRYNPVGRKRTYPGHIKAPDDVQCSFNITEYVKTKFQRMDVTDWVNNMLYALSTVYNRRGISINQSGIDQLGGDDIMKYSDGLYYTDIAFTVTVGKYGNIKPASEHIGVSLIEPLQYIRLNFYNNLQPINTNYTMTDNIINIYAL